MVAPVEVGGGGVALLVSNGLLKQHQVADRKAVGEACLGALEAWAVGRGAVPRAVEQNLRPSSSHKGPASRARGQ